MPSDFAERLKQYQQAMTGKGYQYQINHPLVIEQETLDHENLSGLDLINVKFHACSLQKVDFWQADLAHCVITQCDLSGANLQEAIFAKTMLIDCQLVDANLEKVNFMRIDLTRVDLSGANLHCADLKYAALDAVNLSHADLRGAEFNGARFIECDFCQVQGIHDTVFQYFYANEQGELTRYQGYDGDTWLQKAILPEQD